MEVSGECRWVDEGEVTKYSERLSTSRAVQRERAEWSANVLELLEGRMAITKWNSGSHGPAAVLAGTEQNSALLHLPASRSFPHPQVRHSLQPLTYAELRSPESLKSQNTVSQTWPPTTAACRGSSHWDSDLTVLECCLDLGIFKSPHYPNAQKSLGKPSEGKIALSSVPKSVIVCWPSTFIFPALLMENKKVYTFYHFCSYAKRTYEGKRT